MKSSLVATMHAILDILIAVVLSALSYLLVKQFSIKPDGSLHASALAFTLAAFTVSAFVCTMNYTVQNNLLAKLLETQRSFFTSRWIALFSMEVLSALLPFASMLLIGKIANFSIAISVFAVILATLQIIRSIRLLVMLARISELNRIEEKFDQREEDLKEKMSKHMLEQARINAQQRKDAQRNS